MKKALTTIICVLAMLCFGFVAVGMQITAPVTSARTYKEEFVHVHEYDEETGFCICGKEKPVEEPDEEVTEQEEGEGAPVALSEEVTDENTETDNTEEEVPAESVKEIALTAYEDVTNEGLTVEFEDGIYVVKGEVPATEGAEKYGCGAEREDGVITNKVFVLKLTTAKLDAEVEGTIAGEATTNKFTAENFDGEDFIYLILDGRTYEYVITYGDNVWTVHVNANKPVVEEPVHEHVFVEKRVEATCTEDAYTYTECECGEKTEAVVEEGTALGHRFYDAEGKCLDCGELDADEEHWIVEEMPFNRYILKLVGLEDKEAMAEGAFWYNFTEIAAIGLFAVMAFMLGLVLAHKFVKKDKTPRAPKQKKVKVKKAKQSAAEMTTTNGPRVKW